MAVSKLQYGFNELVSNGLDKNWWQGRFRERILRPYFEYTHASPDPKIPDADWDTLLLLDACRYDLFAESTANLPGVLSKRSAHASATPGYLSANFEGETFHDIVYVTANPFVNTELPDGTFHDVIPVWQDGWDEDSGTVPPEPMLTAAREAVEKYNNKRIIIHFCQPHYPFIGDMRMGDCSISTIRDRAANEPSGDKNESETTPFDMLKRGEVTHEAVWEAYQSNLERVLPAVRSLLNELEGRTVVTSDHGNALGEFALPFPVRIYGHPRGVRIPSTVHVPWSVYETGERRSTTAESPVQDQMGTSSDTEERLRALGYTE